VSEVDSRFPSGDQGGNLDVVPDPTSTGVNELHAVWDSVIYQYPGYEVLPMDAVWWKFYSDQASKIMASHSVDPFQIKAGDYAAWAAESYQMAEDVVYQGKRLSNAPNPFGVDFQAG